MGLVAETRGICDLGDRHLALDEQLFGVFDTTLDDIAMWAYTRRGTEGT